MATSFTSEEIEIINYIKEGTKKLIENILLKEIKSPKKYANKQALTKIRPSTHAFLIHEIIQIFRKDKNYIFRPIDLKKRLPDSLKIIEDYDSELSRILQSLIRSNLIVHSSRLPTKKGPGHPMKNEGRYYTTSGPKSYYEASPFLIKIITIMNNPEACKIIFYCLSKSNMLFDLYEKSNLIYSNLLNRIGFKLIKCLGILLKLKQVKLNQISKNNLKAIRRNQEYEKKREYTKCKILGK